MYVPHIYVCDICANVPWMHLFCCLELFLSGANRLIQSGQYKSYCNGKLKRIATDKERKEQSNGETKRKKILQSKDKYRLKYKHRETKMKRQKRKTFKASSQRERDLSAKGFQNP